MEPVNTQDFKITDQFSIKDRPTAIDISCSPEEIEAALKKLSKKLYKIQEMMFANNR